MDAVFWHSNPIEHVHAARQALMDCSKAIEFWADWSKPYFRMGSAHLALGNWDAAMQACRTGEALLRRKVRLSLAGSGSEATGRRTGCPQLHLRLSVVAWLVDPALCRCRTAAAQISCR